VIKYFRYIKLLITLNLKKKLENFNIKRTIA